MATVVSTSKSKYAGKSIKTLSDGSKVRVNDKTGKSGTGSSRAIDTTSQAGLNRFSGELAADTEARAERAAEAPVSPVAPTTAGTPVETPGAPVTPPTVPVPTPVAPVAPPVGAVTTPAAAATPTQTKYQQGLATAQSTGVPAPQDAGAARSMAAAYTPKETDTSAVDAFISDDPAINTLMSGITQLLNPQKQTSTLMQDYKKLYKDSGLDEINEELIDADTVINGTEDDIRNEIQTAGGFGTESQVQAMSLARNKGLLKRYNQLVQMKTDATNQLNTLSQLNAQDKEIAQKKIDSNISTMFNMANFRQQAVNNTRQQYQWMATQMGADGLYNSLSNDPRQLAAAEKILGTGPGGLQKIAATAAKERAQKSSMEERQIRATESNAALGWARLDYDKNKPADNPYGTLNGKPQTTSQARVNGYADRVLASSNKIGQMGSKFTGVFSALGESLWNPLKSADRQSYEQSQRDFVNAVLRQESGANIAPTEFESAQKQYFPQAGDKPTTVEQKAANRAIVINSLYREANAVNPGAVITPDGIELIPL